MRSPHSARPIARRSCRVLASGALVAAAAVAAPALVAPIAHAQNAPSKPDASAPRFMVVTTEKAKVRSGAGGSYYEFWTLGDGAVVKVVDRKLTWCAVRTEGAAFREGYAWIRQRRDRGPALDPRNGGRLEPGTYDPPREAVTATTVELLAPNKYVDEGEADKSWKTLVSVPSGEPLRVFEVSDRGDGWIAYRVELPPNALGWVNVAELAPATAEQAKRFAYVPPTPKPEAEQTTPDRVAQGAGAERPAAERATPAATDTRTMDPVTPPADRTVEMGGAKTVTAPPAAEATRTNGEPEDDEPAGGTTGTAEPIFDDLPASTREARERSAVASLEPRERLAHLEGLYEELRAQPIEDAEVGPLKQLFDALAADQEATPAIRGYAGRRSEQLAIWGRLQERRLALAAVRSRLELTEDEAAVIDAAMEATVPYAAVGRLAASTIFDGRRFPRLFRVTEPTSGRTLAYVRATGDDGLESLVGVLVGVTGESTFDPGLQLDVVEPRRFDRLDRTPTKP